MQIRHSCWHLQIEYKSSDWKHAELCNHWQLCSTHHGVPWQSLQCVGQYKLHFTGTLISWCRSMGLYTGQFSCTLAPQKLYIEGPCTNTLKYSYRWRSSFDRSGSIKACISVAIWYLISTFNFRLKKSSLMLDRRWNSSFCYTKEQTQALCSMVWASLSRRGKMQDPLIQNSIVFS